MPLYFAYGSNMNERRLQERVPGSRKVGTGFLRNHEFLFSGFSKTWNGSVGNVAPKRGARVFGVLYELPEGGIDKLDRFEGYPRAYQRKTAPIHPIPSGAARRAVLYYKKDKAPLAPASPEYVALIRAALAHHGAP